MKIGSYRALTMQGYPVLEVEIDGRVARLPWEQKALPDGLVFLGVGFEDYTAILPADPEDGRPTDRNLEAFSDDLALVRLVEGWLNA